MKGRMIMLKIGTKAPDFTLPDKTGKPVSLHDFLGKKVVLYFYPKDGTPGCTKQAQAFRDFFEEYDRLGAVIIGISKDSIESHLKFATKHELPFILLSDNDLTVVKAYEAWRSNAIINMMGLSVKRSTYVINEEGIIEQVWGDASATANPSDVLSYLNRTCPLDFAHPENNGKSC